MAAATSHRVEQSSASESHTSYCRCPMSCRDWVLNQLHQNQSKDDTVYAEQMPDKAKNEAGKAAGQNTFATCKQRTNKTLLTQQRMHESCEYQ